MEACPLELKTSKFVTPWRDQGVRMYCIMTRTLLYKIIIPSESVGANSIDTNTGLVPSLSFTVVQSRPWWWRVVCARTDKHDCFPYMKKSGSITCMHAQWLTCLHVILQWYWKIKSCQGLIGVYKPLVLSILPVVPSSLTSPTRYILYTHIVQGAICPTYGWQATKLLLTILKEQTLATKSMPHILPSLHLLLNISHVSSLL